MTGHNAGSDVSLAYSTLSIVHNGVDLLIILRRCNIGVDTLVILLARLYWEF